MNKPSRVNPQARRAGIPTGARYPRERRKLLEALQHRRGDEHLSQTIVAALDALLAANGLLAQDDREAA